MLIQTGKIFLVDLLGISYEQKAFQPSEWYSKLDFVQPLGNVAAKVFPLKLEPRPTLLIVISFISPKGVCNSLT